MVDKHDYLIMKIFSHQHYDINIEKLASQQITLVKFPNDLVKAFDFLEDNDEVIKEEILSYFLFFSSLK